MANKPDIGFTGNVIHVIPYHDYEMHDEKGNQCPCKPTVQMIGIKTIIVHNSFDGREFIEKVQQTIMNKQTFPEITDSFTELKN